MMKDYSKVQTVIPPEGGWQSNTLYLVDVAYFENNPIHRALFFSGFLHKGKPNGYHGIMSKLPSTHYHELDRELHQVYYLKVIRVLASEEELYDDSFKLPPKGE